MRRPVGEELPYSAKVRLTVEWSGEVGAVTGSDAERLAIAEALRRGTVVDYNVEISKCSTGRPS